MSDNCETLLKDIEITTQRLVEADPLDFVRLTQALDERAAAIERFSAALKARETRESADRPNFEGRVLKALIEGNHAVVRLTAVRQAFSQDLAGVNRSLRALGGIRAGLAQSVNTCEWRG